MAERDAIEIELRPRVPMPYVQALGGLAALAVCEALREADPRDGVAAVALAELLLERGDAKTAADVLRSADVLPELAHAEAVLETRALRLAGRAGEAESRWRRYLEARKGAERKWV